MRRTQAPRLSSEGRGWRNGVAFSAGAAVAFLSAGFGQEQTRRTSSQQLVASHTGRFQPHRLFSQSKCRHTATDQRGLDLAGRLVGWSAGRLVSVIKVPNQAAPFALHEHPDPKGTHPKSWSFVLRVYKTSELFDGDDAECTGWRDCSGSVQESESKTATNGASFLRWGAPVEVEVKAQISVSCQSHINTGMNLRVLWYSRS